MQREIPEHINIEAAKIAKKNGVISVLDMGGNDSELSSELLGLITYVSPNETELSRVIKCCKENHLTESEKELVDKL